MSLVFLIAGKWVAEGREITVQLAVYGHLIGEIGAASFNLLCLGLFPPQERNTGRAEDSSCLMPLMALALPLMGNRLILNFLAGAEAVWIPNRLQMSGLSDAEAFSVYGILTGMALPFILFPSAITNSIAVLLLPSVAKDQAEGRTESISGSVSMALRYSLYMGILCIGIFVLFGLPLGISVFKEEEAGRCMQILAWLCPFLYLAATMGSILNGLGCTRTTFLQSVAAMLLRRGSFCLFLCRRGIARAALAGKLFKFTCREHSVLVFGAFLFSAAQKRKKPVFLFLLRLAFVLFGNICDIHAAFLYEMDCLYMFGE